MNGIPAFLVPVATDGDVVTALPFFAPILLLAAVLAFIVIRDRRGGGDAEEATLGKADLGEP